MKVDSLLDVVHQILARDVAHAFQLAKLLGIQIPAAYDVGLRYRMEHNEHEGQRIRFTLRAADTSLEVSVLVPYLTGRVSLARVDKLWKIALGQLHACAISLAPAWIAKHPESHQGVAVIAQLDGHLKDPALQEAWSEQAKIAAQALSYVAR